ncbi:uncharacterized protein LOC143644835 [Tamandua tetradactyla]|uniref:uncharacterized protein LOC143644835 n=1 Tax=Tamandua tetradactyla TaxID=48850 RepID=UPI0040543C96
MARPWEPIPTRALAEAGAGSWVYLGMPSSAVLCLLLPAWRFGVFSVFPLGAPILPFHPKLWSLSSQRKLRVLRMVVGLEPDSCCLPFAERVPQRLRLSSRVDPAKIQTWAFRKATYFEAAVGPSSVLLAFLKVNYGLEIEHQNEFSSSKNCF